MNLQELLNTETDFASLAAMARRGWRWWVGELAEMLPASWRGGLSRRPRWVAERRPSGDWRLWRDGAPAAPGEAPGPVALALSPEAVFVRDLQFPRMSAADLRSLVGMDLDRLSPLAPDLVHFDLEVLERETADGRQSVRLGVAPKALLSAEVEAASAAGLQPASLGVPDPADPSRLAFDFLPAVRAEGGDAAERRFTAYAWAGVAALLLANVVLLIARDVSDTAKLHALVDAQAPAVNAEMRLRAKVDGEEARRAALTDPTGGRPSLARVLTTLTLATPASAWVQKLEWNGRAVRLDGFHPPGVDMLAAIRAAGLFDGAHSLASQPPAAGGVQPFDIAADIRPLTVRPLTAQPLARRP